MDHLAGEEKKLLQILEDNSDVFALGSSELGATTVVTHSIDTGTSKPICRDQDVPHICLTSKGESDGYMPQV